MKKKIIATIMTLMILLSLGTSMIYAKENPKNGYHKHPSVEEVKKDEEVKPEEAKGDANQKEGTKPGANAVVKEKLVYVVPLVPIAGV